jgi:perosamine synthetase
VKSLFYPAVLKEEWLEELSKIFDTRWLGQGPKVNEFEEEFSRKFDYNYCLALNSGSSALELAYHLVGIKEGDEVLTPIFTCTATNIPLKRRNANIKFIDIDDKLNPSFEDIEKKITKNTKAIVVVNLGGILHDRRIYDLAKMNNIPLIVDACQSLGIEEPHGDYICYSFQAIKHFTTGDGGMLVVKNKDEYDRAKILRWFGIDREKKIKNNWAWIVNHQMALDIEEPGFKYHMNDIMATMGLVGLRNSDKLLEKRKEIASVYFSMFNTKIPERYKYIPTIYGGSYWLFAIITKNRNKMIESLKSNGIESDPIQLRNDIFSIFGGKKQDLPNMNEMENKYLYIPMHINMTCEEAEEIANCILTYERI